MHMLDSDIGTLVFYGRNQKVREKYESFPTTERLTLSVVVRAEILGGRLEAIKKAATPDEWLTAQTRLNDTEDWLAKFSIIPVNQRAADHFGRQLLNKKVKKLGRSDLLIACIALAHDATLITRNVKDYAPIPNLRVENWAD